MGMLAHLHQLAKAPAREGRTVTDAERIDAMRTLVAASKAMTAKGDGGILWYSPKISSYLRRSVVPNGAPMNIQAILANLNLARFER